MHQPINVKDEVLDFFLKRDSKLFKYRTARVRVYTSGKITNLRNKHMGNKCAKILMLKVCAAADQANIPLWLWAKPSDDSAYNLRELCGFYAQFGFKEHAYDYLDSKTLMIRPCIIPVIK
jgi:hypothetical protein